MLEFYDSSTPKARKEYTCDFCNQKIQIGEKYSRFSGKYDGDMFDVKHHLLCERICRAYCDWANDNEYSNDDVQDWLQSEICYDCKHYEDDDCEEHPLSCPIIRATFEKGGAE